MSNLFYRGGGGCGRVPICLFKKKLRKNYMGQFVFSRGVRVYLLIPMPKKIHNTLVATFNIMAIIISFI